MAIITTEALKWSCKKNKIAMGGANHKKDLMQPFQKNGKSFLCSDK